MATLIVTLGAEPADASASYDYLLTSDGSAIVEQSRAPLALLPSPGHAGTVVALVPAQQLSWHQVQLPKGSLGRGIFRDGSAERLRTVLEGVLEDQLLDEPALVHFALQPDARDQATVWVAVCERAWLRAAVQALERCGRAASRIVPEFAPDALADALHVIGEPQQAWIVFAAHGGMVCWPLSPASVALAQWPDTVPVVAEPAVAALAEQLFKRNVTLQQVAQRRLQSSASAWDLAQFDLASSNRSRSWRRLSAALASLWRAPRWRAARVALAALVLVNLVGLNAWAWNEHRALQARRAQINAVLTDTFPKVAAVVDAPVQMAKEVALLQRASGVAGGTDLDVMLEVFAAAEPATAPPSAIEFAGGELRLRGLKLAPQAIAALSFKLKPQGYQASADGDAVLIRQVAPP